METFTPDTNNQLFQLGINLVNHSARNIFLTGRAGTGKTTFLKYIRTQCPKQMAVVAPTGVAAINAGGVTIHSFFQLPLSPFVPGTSDMPGASEYTVDRAHLLSRLRMNSEKRNILRELELLIIDEISMVRADTLDALDTVLRRVRHQPQLPFGGVQVLMIGDLYQLPPVRNEENWKWLEPFYNNPYFFSSRVMQEDTPVYLEFTKIYRQKDETFIRLLNQVRNNRLDEDGIALLQSRYQPVINRSKDDDAVILTTHNEAARNINNAELAKLDSPVKTYEATRSGDFNANLFPADESLVLRKGARVMFLRNDMDRRKRFYNGKTGVITKLDNEQILVQCKDEDEPIEVKRETWQTIRYALNNETRKMEEEVLGSYTQFPLRLAWAITIHKSQGLTFEKAIIDAGKAFSPGQVYVALSRCTSLEGITLQTPIRPGSLATDSAIDQFISTKFADQNLDTELEKARQDFHLQQLMNIFGFDELLKTADSIKNHILKNKSAFSGGNGQFSAILPEKLELLQKPGKQFIQWLIAQFSQINEPGTREMIAQKIKSGSAHFSALINPVLNLLLRPDLKTANKALAQPIHDSARDLFNDLSFRLHMISGNGVFMDTDAWYRHKSQFRQPPFYINIYAGKNEDTDNPSHPELQKALRILRDQLADEKQVPIYMVAGKQTIVEMAEYLPTNESEIMRIHGFGPAKMKMYGKQFLEVINEYCEEFGLESSIPDDFAVKKPKKAKTEKEAKPKHIKGSTRTETLNLFRAGKSIAEIAALRNLTIGTIENHFIPFLQSGELKPEDLMSAEKIKMIENLMEPGNRSVSSIKAELGEAVSFNEIRWIFAPRQARSDSSVNLE